MIVIWWPIKSIKYWEFISQNGDSNNHLMRYHGIFCVCWTWDNPQLQPIIHNYPHCFLYFNNFLMWDTLSSLDKPTKPTYFLQSEMTSRGSHWRFTLPVISAGLDPQPLHRVPGLHPRYIRNDQKDRLSAMQFAVQLAEQEEWLTIGSDSPTWKMADGWHSDTLVEILCCLLSICSRYTWLLAQKNSCGSWHLRVCYWLSFFSCWWDYQISMIWNLSMGSY